MTYEAEATVGPDHYASLLARLTELARTCTCATTAIEQCPNYIPGLDDEEDDAVRVKKGPEWVDAGTRGPDAFHVEQEDPDPEKATELLTSVSVLDAEDAAQERRLQAWLRQQELGAA